MRKVIYYIDDNEYLRNQLSKETTNQQDIEKIMEMLPEDNLLKAVYTLTGNRHDIYQYSLHDTNGNLMPINLLNNFQRAVILGDCNLHFEGALRFTFGDTPQGIIRIDETEI